MKTALALVLLLLSPAAFAGCLEDAGQRLVSCRQACWSKWTETGRQACATECNANYYAEKRACTAGDIKPAEEDSLITRAHDDDVCEIIRSESDGRLRAVCTIDGTVYETWGQCKTYCR